MKKVFILLASSILTISLTNCGNNSSTENTSISDSITGSDIDNTPDIEVVKTFNPQIKKIKRELHYRASLNHDFYATAKYDIEWPVSADGYDIKPLQKILIKNLFGEESTDIEKQIKEAGQSWFNDNVFTEFTWEPVREIPDHDDDDAGEYKVGDAIYWGAPEYSAEIEFNGVDNDLHLAEFEIELYFYNGSGTGAGAMSYKETFYYDYERSKVLELSDIVIPESEDVILKKLNGNPVGKDEYSCLWDSKIENLPDNFVIKKGVLYFLFPKYEVACGADGNVMLGVKLSSLKQYLTPLGQTFKNK